MKSTNRAKRAILALAVSMLLSAGLAQAAHGAGEFKAAEYPVTLNGEQVNENVLTLGPRKVSCTELELTGELTKAQATVATAAKYGNCSSLGLETTIDMNSCYYEMTVTTKPNVNGTGTGHTSIACAEPGDEIHITVTKENGGPHDEAHRICTYGIPAQGPLASFEYHNKGFAQDVELTMFVEKITVNVVSGTKLSCGAASGGQVASGYEGKLTMTGQNAELLPVAVQVG